MATLASSETTYEVSTNLPLTRPASAALRSPAPIEAATVIDGDGVIEVALAAIRQGDDGHAETFLENRPGMGLIAEDTSRPVRTMHHGAPR